MTNITFSEPQNTPHCHALFEVPAPLPAGVGRHTEPRGGSPLPGLSSELPSPRWTWRPPARALLFHLAAGRERQSRPPRPEPSTVVDAIDPRPARSRRLGIDRKALALR